jgi:very-short-patch-repair endonuclease
MTELGFSPQYKVLTGVHTNKLPRMFRLDFAIPERKLYVEIDGSTHRLRKERDARRDAMLSDLGWLGLRIPSSQVENDIEVVKVRISLWLSDKLLFPLSSSMRLRS